MNILEDIDDPHLLGASIRDPESWKPWRAFLAAAFGAPMDASEAAIYRQCTGRTELPAAAFRFLWLIIGRRGGKSFAMALLATFMGCFRDWRPFLSPGEKAVILVVAGDREQAKILTRYVKGILETPLLAPLVEGVTADSVELRGNVVIEVVTRSFRAVRGRSVCGAILDELAFWRDDSSANPDEEVLSAIIASMATFGDHGLVIGASSPYAKSGVLYGAYKKFYGVDDLHNLVWKAPTRVMNPSVPQSFIDREYARDAAKASGEYGAEFRSDIESFVSLEVVEGCVIEGRFELPPAKGVKYIAFTDPSGGSQDSMTLAIAHNENGKAVVDAIREAKPPFSPDQVVEEFCSLIKSYGIYEVEGDNYGSEWPKERFRKHGVKYNRCLRVRSDLYKDLLPLLNSQQVELLHNQKATAQIATLERRTTKSGKDSINHADGCHDDVANAIAGAATIAVGFQKKGPVAAFGQFRLAAYDLSSRSGGRQFRRGMYGGIVEVVPAWAERGEKFAADDDRNELDTHDIEHDHNRMINLEEKLN